MKLILLVVPILAVTALPQSHIPEVTTSNSFRQPVVVPVASQRASLDDLLDGSAGCGGPNTECVPYHLCNNQVPTENLVDITLSDSGPCPGSLDVCCVSANKVNWLNTNFSSFSLKWNLAVHGTQITLCFHLVTGNRTSL